MTFAMVPTIPTHVHAACRAKSRRPTARKSRRLPISKSDSRPFHRARTFHRALQKGIAEFSLKAYHPVSASNFKRARMRRFVSLILLTVILACQALCAAHTHIGLPENVKESHAGRPHFHFHGRHTHHGHGHHGHATAHHSKQSALPDTAALPDAEEKSSAPHDSDAFFSPDLASSSSNETSIIELPDRRFFELADAPYGCTEPIQRPLFDLRRELRSQWSIARGQLYLRSHSIRC